MTAIALIARPGVARERLVDALRGIGMELVLQADPAEASDDQILASGAHALVIALDAGGEDMLDRFDRTLGDPNITVLLEEAEMIASRNGWDAARWSRHIAAKLGGHDRVIAPLRPVATGAATGGDGAGPPPVVTSPPPPPPRESGGLKLVDHDFDPSTLPPSPLDEEQRARRLVGLEPGGVRLSLVGPEPPPSAAPPPPRTGAVMIEGGLGAPDALRRLLGGIPEGFPLPVLVRIMLEGGRYDSLVKQMKRVATLPMKVARSGDSMQPGTIYFLAPTLSAELRDNGLAFVDVEPAGSTASLHAALLADDSALLMLSGAHPDLVEPAVAYADSGAWVAAQAPETCYDATVPNALILRGAQAAPAADLVAHLVERWPARRAQA